MISRTISQAVRKSTRGREGVRLDQDRKEGSKTGERPDRSPMLSLKTSHAVVINFSWRRRQLPMRCHQLLMASTPTSMRCHQLLMALTPTSHALSSTSHGVDANLPCIAINCSWNRRQRSMRCHQLLMEPMPTSHAGAVHFHALLSTSHVVLRTPHAVPRHFTCGRDFPCRRDIVSG